MTLCWFPSVAHADDAGPSTFRSEVVSVEPSVAGLHVEVVGGDSFVSLRNDTGQVVVVTGYSGEPYVRFGADGRVEENLASPTAALNLDRYGAVDPGTVSAVGTEPRWRLVATDGQWAWHDHRVHWMSPTPPLGLGPGDQVVDGVVPLLVDGQRVDVRVASVWVAPPSRLPIVGAVMAAGLGVALVLRVRGRRPWFVLTGVAAVSATVVGGWEYWSLPPAARPSIAVVATPGAALVAVVAGWWACRQQRDTSFVVVGALMAAGLELGLWSWRRFDGLLLPVLPTTLEPGIDRATTVFAAVVALAAVVRGVADLTSALRPGPHGEQPVDDLGDLLVRQ
jgi:hypothetical protein